MDQAEMWRAVITRDRSYDGKFFYGVKSTGIFCRPSCPSRNPKPENIVYFDTKQQALEAGFRPCKRCRPDLLFFDPAGDIVEQARQAIDLYYSDEEALELELLSLGVTQRHLAKLFEQRYDMPTGAYLRQVRLERAKALLSEGKSATDTALSVGFDTPSAFSTFFRKATGMTPRDFARGMRDVTRACCMETPVGSLILSESDRGLTKIRFGGPEEQPVQARPEGLYLKDAVDQLGEYFTGRRQTFDLPVDLRGSAFQMQVWDALCQIPYGEKRNYGAVAEEVGNPKASRAVGMAANKNPLLILIPCHRVVGRDGQLVGYAGGIERKEYLLRLEASAR